MNRLDETAALAAPRVAFDQAERYTPRFTGSAVLALVAAPVAAGVGGGFVFLFLAVALRFSWPWRWASGGFALAGGLALVLVLVNWLNLAQQREVITGPETAAPVPVAVPAETVRVEVHEPERGRWAFLDLPGTPEQLEQVGRGLLLGRPFAETEWTGSGRPYSKGQFVQLRAELLERGVLAWRDEKAHAQGVELTAAGRAVFRALVEQAGNARTHALARDGGGLLTSGDGQQGGRAVGADLAE